MNLPPAPNLSMRRVPAAMVVWLVAGPVFANPSGPVIRHGDIRISGSGANLEIHQATSHGIIDWNSFSIQEGGVTRFLQPGASAATLNRVTGASLSRIDGSLLANGRVLLLNPNGILIGRDGVVDTGGFTASTLDLSNADFLAGGDLRFQGNSTAGIVNLGSINAVDGDIFLIAASVLNEGSLRARNGTVGLAAGNDVLIAESGSERVFVRGAGNAGEDSGVINRGTVSANVAELKSYGGNIYGMAVKNEGRVAATAVTREGGQIFLRAGGGGRVQTSGSLIAKKQDSGGSVVVESGPGGATEVDGVIDAGSSGGTGGVVVILGSTIDLFEDSVILADGGSDGGRIFVGGGKRGLDPDFHHATNVTVAGGVTLSANAGALGNGGEIIVFAENRLEFSGALSATGGTASGDGGFAELSGKNEILVPDLTSRVSLTASNGRGGTLLFDPNDIEIIVGSEGKEGGNFPAGLNKIVAGDIISFLETGSNLVIATNAPGEGGSGDIVVRTGVELVWEWDGDGDANLTFTADRDFLLERGASIRALKKGSVMIDAGRSVQLGAELGAEFSETTTLGGGIFTNTGDIVIRGNFEGTMTGDFTGVEIDSLVVAGAGQVTIGGVGGDGEGNSGVVLKSFSNIVGGTGVTIEGGAQFYGDTGVTIEGGAQFYGDTGLLAEGSIHSSGGSVALSTIGGDLLVGGSVSAYDRIRLFGDEVEDSNLFVEGYLDPYRLEVNGGGGTNLLDFSAYTGYGLSLGADQLTGISELIGSGSFYDTFAGAQDSPAEFIVTGVNSLTYEEGEGKQIAVSGFGIIRGGLHDDVFTIDTGESGVFSGELDGGAGDDTFVFLPGGGVAAINGGIGTDTLDFSSFTSPVTVDIGNRFATQVSSFQSIESVVGGSGLDTLSGTAANDQFLVDRDGGGFLNSGRFESFEILLGQGGADRFVFQNQATVARFDGGGGIDTFVLDDSSLGGTNVYTISGNSVSRNPSYFFSGIEFLQLLLGPGNDTVIADDNGLIQILNGGGGTDTIDFGATPVSGRTPFLFGGTQVFETGFENFLFVRDESNNPENITPSLPGNRSSAAGGTLIDQFSNTGGLGQALGNAFGVIEGSALIAGQASVIQVDGGQYRLEAPASLDGFFTQPPPAIIELLNQNLEVDAWTELATAINFEGAMILVLSDGPLSISLDNVPPDEILPLLAESLLADPARELFDALELAFVIPITSLDGAVSIFTIPVVVDPAIPQQLLGNLDETAAAELTAALGD